MRLDFFSGRCVNLASLSIARIGCKSVTGSKMVIGALTCKALGESIKGKVEI